MKPPSTKIKAPIIFGALSILGSLHLFATQVPAEITSDGPSEFKNGIAYASENVTIKYDGLVVKADHVEYNPESRKALLFKKGDNDAPWIPIATLLMGNTNQIPPAQAAEQKLASVNLNRVFISLDVTKKAEAEMNAARTAAREEWEGRKAALAEAVKAADPKVPEMEKELAELQSRSEKELQEKFQSLRKPILESILAATRAVQTREGYTFVLDTSAILASGAPVVFAAPDAPDITDQVLAEAGQLNP